MVILSVSRRTDIPAYYGRWLLNRLREGWLLIPNPRNPRRLSRVELNPEKIDAIVLMTKNPAPMLPLLKELDDLGYRGRYGFQISLTAFDSEAEEPGLPPKEQLVESFRQLARLLGPERLVWRFDPIMVNERYSAAWHGQRFRRLAAALRDCTRRCVISFIDPYRHLGPGFREMSDQAKRVAASEIGGAAGEFGLPVFTCAEEIDLREFGVGRGACFDPGWLEMLAGTGLDFHQASGQRAACLCPDSVDIGMYDTCLNGCSYCYATTRRGLAAARHAAHDPRSPLLSGWPVPDQEILDCRRQGSLKKRQPGLFD